MSFDIPWKLEKLKNVSVKIGSGATPRGGKESYVNDGIPFIRSQNIYNNYFSFDGLAFINENQAKKLDNVTVIENDVLLNITGDSVCRCTIVPKELLPARVNQHVAIIRSDKSKLNPFYLKSYLVSRDMQTFMLSLAQTGGTRAALTKGMIEDFMIPLPSIKEQESIATLLKTIDDKIELNNSINSILEELAQALFKRWFVDFEFPNENGEPYKSSGGEFEESELGLIPKNWEVGNLKDFIVDMIGGDWGKETSLGNYTEEVTCIRGADIPELSIGNRGKVVTRYILKKNCEKKRLSSGDIVIEISGGSPTQSTGRTVLITKDLLSKFSTPVISTNFCRIIKPVTYRSEFLYSYIQFLYKQDILYKYENGTTGIKNLDVNSLFYNFKIPLPNNQLINKFGELFNSLYQKIQINGNGSESLGIVRDSLLSKLMSGEIRVPMEENTADLKHHTYPVEHQNNALPMAAEERESYNTRDSNS